MAQPCGLVLIRQHSVVITSGCADQLAMPSASRCCVGNTPTIGPSARIQPGQDPARSDASIVNDLPFGVTGKKVVVFARRRELVETISPHCRHSSYSTRKRRSGPSEDPAIGETVDYSLNRFAARRTSSPTAILPPGKIGSRNTTGACTTSISGLSQALPNSALPCRRCTHGV